MKEIIEFEDFEKLDIRIGKITEVKKVADADKLLKIQMDFGGETKQIVSSIAQDVEDIDSLVGKEMPVLLNLEPRKFRGEESQGMILMAVSDNEPIFLLPESDIPPGAEVR
ncbi:MAG: tRNA-binding protein [Patescibacteria group bacterium]|nr:tRNA-binding protein [Patescibacteria group bacterium]